MNSLFYYEKVERGKRHRIKSVKEIKDLINLSLQEDNWKCFIYHKARTIAELSTSVTLNVIDSVKKYSSENVKNSAENRYRFET